MASHIPAGPSFSLHEMLMAPCGFFYFSQHLEHEHSRENIEFYYEVNQFKVITDEPELLIEEAERLFSIYIEDKSIMQVNIDSKERTRLEKMIVARSGIESNLFDLAQQEIFKLMEKDSFPRFLRSKEYPMFMTAGARMRHELPKDKTSSAWGSSSIKSLKKAISFGTGSLHSAPVKPKAARSKSITVLSAVDSLAKSSCWSPASQASRRAADRSTFMDSPKISASGRIMWN